MNFIKKVFDGESDLSVHLQFQKFSKGEFRNRALIEAKNSNGKYTIKTSSEFVNEFVRAMAEKLGDKITEIKGVIVSTNDLEGLDYKNKKQFMGIKQYVIDKEMSGNDIIELLKKFPKAFFALSFEAGDNKLKIKPKAPKSAKSSSKEEEKPKADFCKIVTTDVELGKSFVFEKLGFKEARINHTFFIERIEIPEELKNSKDFALIREKSKRVGRIVRKAVIDGVEKVSEKEFAG